ncbi:hypothetical protein H8Z76_05475 [Roseburia sp. BX0805]|uniref:DUF5067 domain-containing protein n=1 Tax=Roseburia yibonii TaxID=2763063 RepID=A0ABR7I991_9FIRM|nr:hypothetical protein [Roseburia yibonii]MBC5753482.1 hypothetical protein [Roseburia yibonii]
MSNEFENNNDGGEDNQNPYYQDYGAPSQGSGQQENNTDPYQNAGNQDYSNPYQSGQQDYSNPYQSGQQTYGGYNPYGNVPLDKKGQPLKNRFGMKLTFSILEMISGNLISLICGIIACVFTCKANTAYKEGKWEEFKSNAKISNIFLWIGLGVCLAFYVIVIILIAAVGLSVLPFIGSGSSGSSATSGSYDYYDEQDYNYYDDTDDYDDEDDDADEEETEDYADDWEEEDTEDADTGYASAGVTAGSGYTDPTVTINGATVTFPLSYADFVAETGLTMDADETGDIVSADGYDNYDITNAYDSEGNDVCSIWLYNMSGSDLAMEDCYVAGIIAYNDGYSTAPDLVMQNGITFASTQDEVRTALGEPSNTYSDTYSDGSLYESWNWDYADPDSDYFDEVQIEFVDGVITKIEVDNATLPAGQ